MDHIKSIAGNETVTKRPQIVCFGWLACMPQL
jgi:hypothetical protein